MGRLLIALAACALFVSAGCASAGTLGLEAEIKASVEAFHARVNQERYSEVYEHASEELRGRLSREAFTELLAESRRRTGATGGEAGVFIVSDNWKGQLRRLLSGDETITSVAITKCENGHADERFSWLIRGGKAKLAGYELMIVREPGKIYGIGPAK